MCVCVFNSFFFFSFSLTALRCYRNTLCGTYVYVLKTFNFFVNLWHFRFLFHDTVDILLSLQFDLTKNGESCAAKTANENSFRKRNSIETSLLRIDTIFIKLERVYSFGWVRKGGRKVVDFERSDKSVGRGSQLNFMLLWVSNEMRKSERMEACATVQNVDRRLRAKTSKMFFWLCSIQWKWWRKRQREYAFRVFILS